MMKDFRGQLICVRGYTAFQKTFIDVRATTLEIIDRNNLFTTLALTLSPQMVYPTSATHFHGVTLDFATTKVFTCYQKTNSQFPAPRPLATTSCRSSPLPCLLDLSDFPAPAGPPKYSNQTLPPFLLLSLAVSSLPDSDSC